MTEELDAFFSGELEYAVDSIWTDHPGKRMFTAHDEDEELVAVNWEGEDRFSYDHDGETQELSEDHELYEVATDLLDAYPVIHMDEDGRQRYAMMSHTNSGGEASRALNEPLEWGVETGYRTWQERQDDVTGPFGKLFNTLLP